jgi:hypothetical protein
LDWLLVLALVGFAAFWIWVIAYGRRKGRSVSRNQTARSLRAAVVLFLLGAAAAALGFAARDGSLIALGLALALTQVLFLAVIAAGRRFLRPGR